MRNRSILATKNKPGADSRAEYNRYPNIPPMRAPARRLITSTVRAATTMRITPSAAASLALPAM